MRPCPPTAIMNVSACHVRPSATPTVCGSRKRAGPTPSKSSTPVLCTYSFTCFFSWAYCATRWALAKTAARSMWGRSPRNPKVSQEPASRAKRAARARVRTGAGPSLILVPPTRLLSSKVTSACSSRACSEAVNPAGPPPNTISFMPLLLPCVG